MSTGIEELDNDEPLVEREWDLDETSATESTEEERRATELEFAGQVESEQLTFFLNQVAVIASILQKLNMTPAINELFEAFMKDKGITYSFPYRRWTDFLKPPYQEEAERLCRVSDTLEKQRQLMSYCIRNNLVDQSKVDENFLLNETQYVNERLRFMLRHLFDVKPFAFSSYRNLQKLLGINYQKDGNGSWTLNRLAPGLMDRYFPNPSKNSQAYFRFLDALEDLTTHQKRTLCNWVTGAEQACSRSNVSKQYNKFDSAKEARPYISNVVHSPNPFPIRSSTAPAKRGFFDRLRRR